MKLFKLDNLGILDVSGERALDYLQGQLSCDIRQVTHHSFQQGALCNLKGRVLALIDIMYWQTYHLIVAKDLIQETCQSLEKTAMLSRVKLSVNNKLSILGLYCDSSDTMLGDYLLPKDILSVLAYPDFMIAKRNERQYLIYIDSTKVSQFIESFSRITFETNLEIWHQLSLEAGQCTIDSSTRGLFLPHRLNLHKLGYLSFNKGCYRGQEVIARMHYRATLKHELVIQKIAHHGMLSKGQRIMNARGETEIGELIDYCHIDKAHQLIAASLLIERPELLYFEGEDKPIQFL